MPEIYEPAEDSYLMSKILKKEIPDLLEQNPDLGVLEVGSGSGIQLETLFNLGIKKENIFSCDINADAVKNCRKMGFNCIQSDLFENIKGRYKVIIFNPPYLPEDACEPHDSKTATTGGKNGYEIINRFLKDAKNYLITKGKIFLLTSSLTKNINWLDYQKKLLGCEKLFFEELKVWEITS